MRIGEFAKINSITIDAVRHYMNMGLLVPMKLKGQYEFTDESQKALKEIIALKDSGFTINEIKTIFMFKLLGNLTNYQVNEYYKMVFESKADRLRHDIEHFSQMLQNIEHRMEGMAAHERCGGFKIGLDISTLSLLKCIACGGDLTIHEGLVEENQLMNGILSCSCGHHYEVEDGILIIHQNSELKHNDFDDDFISKYITTTDARYLDNLYKGIEYAKNKIDFNSFKNKVLLELGSGLGFLLRNIYEKLPEDALYIAVDHDKGRHRFLKSMFESSDLKRNILFICSDFQELPIKKKKIDVVFDISGTSNYSFEHTDFLLNTVNACLSDEAMLVGLYIIFKNFSNKGYVSPEYRKNFSLESIRHGVVDLGFKITDERKGQFIDKGGLYEDYFVKGETVFSYMLIGKRSG